jgi:hypothetical protein
MPLFSIKQITLNLRWVLVWTCGGNTGGSDGEAGDGHGGGGECDEESDAVAGVGAHGGFS